MSIVVKVGIRLLFKYQPCRSEDRSSQEGGDDGKPFSLIQPYNKEDEDLEVVY